MQADEDQARTASGNATRALPSAGKREPPSSPGETGGTSLGYKFAVAGVAALGIVYAAGLIPGLKSPFSSTKPLAGAAAVTEKNAPGTFRMTDDQLKTVTIETVPDKVFRTALATDGKIAIDEDVSTPVYSPYVGRVIKLLAKPGDKVEFGKPLFIVEASDMVQGQNDFLAAKANVDKATQNLRVAEVQLKRARDLLLANAVAKRDLETAEVAQVGAINDMKTGQVALEAARNRLRILGKTDAEITAFESGKLRISAATTVVAPLSGTIVQRKVGPGQLINGASTDPVYVIGDLSTVWLIANVRETDATKISVGQDLEFSILALPDKVFKTKVTYIASSVNPDSHRLQVRAQIANADGQLRPEMFANVSIFTTAEQTSPGAPRNAIMYEGEDARLWVMRDDKSIELRKVTTGISSGGFVQVLDGLKSGEKIVTKGSLFIDRLAAPGGKE